MGDQGEKNDGQKSEPFGPGEGGNRGQRGHPSPLPALIGQERQAQKQGEGEFRQL